MNLASRSIDDDDDYDYRPRQKYIKRDRRNKTSSDTSQLDVYKGADSSSDKYILFATYTVAAAVTGGAPIGDYDVTSIVEKYLRDHKPPTALKKDNSIFVYYYSILAANDNDKLTINYRLAGSKYASCTSTGAFGSVTDCNIP